MKIGFAAAPTATPSRGTTPLVMPPTSAFTQALVQSLARSIQSDTAMWGLDSTIQYRWQSNGVCLPRGQAPRVWRADGPCGLDRIDCNWGFWTVDEVCNRQTFIEHMFQYPRYIWAQTKLRELLARKPTSAIVPATSSTWARWIWDVHQLVSVAYWASNVRANGPGHMGPSRYETRPYLNIKGPAWENWEVRANAALRRQYPERAETTTPKRQVLELKLWGHLPTSGWVNEGGRAVLRGPALPRTRAAFDPTTPLDVRVTGPGHVVSLSWPTGVPRTASATASPLEKLTSYISEMSLVSERVWWREVRQAGVLRDGGPGWMFWPTGELLAAQAEAMAQDVVDRTMGEIVGEGLRRWNEALVQLPGDYRTNFFGSLQAYQEFARSITNSNMDQMMGGIQAGTAIIGAVAGAINAGAGAIIAVYSAMLQGMHEILKATDSYATGSGSIPPCPPLPMIRTMAQSACSFELVDTTGPATLVLQPAHRPSTTDQPPLAPPSSGGGRGAGGSGLVVGGAALALAAFLASR